MSMPLVNDSTCINLGVCISPFKAKPAVPAEQPASLSITDRMWQGAKAGGKIGMWAAPVPLAVAVWHNASLSGIGDEARVPVLKTVAPFILVPAAIGAVSGAVSGMLGTRDRVSEAMHTVTDGPATPLTVGIKTGLVTNGFVSIAKVGSALDDGARAGEVIARVTGSTIATIGTAALSAVAGAKAAATSASPGGAILAGAAGGAATGAAILSTINVAGSLLATGAVKAKSLQAAALLGVLYGGASGIAGAVTQLANRKP